MSLVWVTGARGFIGRYLARYLSDEGHKVIGIGHGRWPRDEAAFWGVSAWVEEEITIKTLGKVHKAFGTPDEVFHLAGGSSVGMAFADPYDDFRRTVEPTAELLAWLHRNAPIAILVAVSSAAVYGNGHNGPITENDSLKPFSPYGAHKLIMEELCRSYAINFGLKIILPRLFSVYGPELKKQLLWDLCGKLASAGPVELGGTGKELRDWTHVLDVVRALKKSAHLADNSAPVLNLATGIGTSIKEIAAIAVSKWEGGPKVSRLHFNGQKRAGDPFSLVADTEKTRSYDICFSIPISQGVGEYVEWYRNSVMGS